MAASLRLLDYSVLQQCMHCGLCLPTCPTYDTTKHERNSPRGRISLMRSIADGALGVTRGFADEMSYCLGCLACQTACPAGVDYAALFETARNDIERQHVHAGIARALLRRLMFGGLFLSPRALRWLGGLVRVYQRSGLESLLRRSRLLRLLPATLRRLEPQLPRMAPTFSDRLIARREQPIGEPRHRVALLTGCVQDLVFSDVNRDTADVLIANGCAVDTPPLQPCCGSLHAHNGERELARGLARRMIDLIPPHRYDAIVSNAGGCGSHLRHYGPLLEDDDRYAEAARGWDAKVRDVHEWLAEIGWRSPVAAPFDTPIALAYHDSCHLAHGQRVTRQPRDLLRSLPGVSFTELTEASWCCGAAGTYAIAQPAQSERLLTRKVAHVGAADVDILATANPGCHLQIARRLDADRSRVRVEHPVSLLARAYRRESSSTHVHEVRQA
jgi:glycolate oxidase iron-sulfur subunit